MMATAARLMGLAVLAALAGTITGGDSNTGTFVSVEQPGSDFGLAQVSDVPVDENGYFLYCSCMGRFGNQASQLLGVLALVKQLNRTLVVPPFISYGRAAKISLTPFEEVFDLSLLGTYHRVIGMQDFMDSIAPSVWPASKRYMYCSRRSGDKPDCRTKQGNPFGPFWDAFGVDFVGDRILNGYYFEGRKFAASIEGPDHFVVAMPGAPAKFPAEKKNWPLARFIDWSEGMKRRGMEMLHRLGLADGSFVALHIRAGSDWARSCEHAIGRPEYMASPQCTLPSGGISQAICLPSAEQVIQGLSAVVQDRDTNNPIQAVFIGTDSKPFVTKLKDLAAKQQHLRDLRIVSSDSDDIFLDLYAMTEASYFLGNCVSSFTAFVTRFRRVRDLPFGFYGV